MIVGAYEGFDGVTSNVDFVAIWAPYLVPLAIAVVVAGLAAGRGIDGRLRGAPAVGVGLVIGLLGMIGVYIRMTAEEGRYPAEPVNWWHVALGISGALMAIRTLRRVMDSTDKKKTVPRASRGRDRYDSRP